MNTLAISLAATLCDVLDALDTGRIEVIAFNGSNEMLEKARALLATCASAAPGVDASRWSTRGRCVVIGQSRTSPGALVCRADTAEHADLIVNAVKAYANAPRDDAEPSPDWRAHADRLASALGCLTESAKPDAHGDGTQTLADFASARETLAAPPRLIKHREDTVSIAAAVDMQGDAAHVWTYADSDAATREGWDVFDNSTHGLEVERLDAWEEHVNGSPIPVPFASDVEAIAHVYGEALRGSALHVKALRITLANRGGAHA